MGWFENLVEKACHRVAKLAPGHRLITRGDNEPYLNRYYFFRREWLRDWFKDRGREVPWIVGWIPSVYLHEFLKGDDEEELHNHPWKKSVAIILTGGYREERRVGNLIENRVLRPGSINVIRDVDFHKVELLDKKRGVWTLFIAGKRNADEQWGFWHPVSGQYVDWRTHVADRHHGMGITWRRGTGEA